MTNLIRQKNKFLYHGQHFFAKDLTLEGFLTISIDPDEGYKQIMLECNDEVPTLNDRQKKEFIKILMGVDEGKSTLMDKLTETQKKIQSHKEKHKEKKDISEFENILQDWHIVEGQVMHFLHQPLSEIRKWPYKYFMQICKDLAYCTGAKEYDRQRNSTKPDKVGFKKEFGNLYNK